jgi:tRNA (guanine-N7-)-methyltransferase
MSTPKSTEIRSEKHRAIRSFVLRAGRLTAGQKRALEELWPLYGIDSPEQPIALQTVFDNTAPITLEIGFGNGESLVHMAAITPAANFIGIEVHPPGVGHCLLAIEAQQLTNVRVLREDAVALLQNGFSDSSLDRVNLFFPDPWHKKRHHKRRIVQAAFVELLAKKIKAAGIFHVATDWPGYAEHIREVMENTQSFKAMADYPQDRIKTRFDARGARLGHANWECAYSNCSK